MDAIADDQMIRLDVLFGHVAIDSWMEWRGNRLVGMGRVKHYDRDGALVTVSDPKPTGIVLEFA